MSGELVVIPLWGKLVLFSLAKKGLVLTAGYLYGFPRLYRRSQKLLRFLVRDKEERKEYQGYLRSGFRLPAKLLHMGAPPQPRMSPALTYLHQMPSKLLPSNRQPRIPRKLRSSFASNPLLLKQSQRWSASREKFSELKEKCSDNMEQAMTRLRAARKNGFVQMPSIYVPGIRLQM